MDDSRGDRGAAPRAVVRALLALLMVAAGIGHFTAHESFLAQTPTWLPWRSAIVYGSGVVEIALGIALVALPGQRRRVGWALAAFYVAIFPGNINQALTGAEAFGLDTPAARWGRLLFQPLLVMAALWSTGAAFGAVRRPRPGSAATPTGSGYVE